MPAAEGARTIAVIFESEWEAEGPGIGRRGFFAPDPRVRTLVRVLLSYSEVRHIVPDRVSLDAGAGSALVDSIAHFLERQRWLIKRVVVG